MAEETQFTANTGMVSISTANTNLDGNGTLGTVLTGKANGTQIKSIAIKATGNTTRGMVRLFVYDGTNNRLLKEIEIDPITKSANNPAFEHHEDLNFNLKNGYILKASTHRAEAFNVIAEGMDYAYYATSVRADTTENTALLGRCSISTANSNLDGTGTLGTAYTAGSSATYLGSSIRTITIKSTVNVTSGMVRLFVQDGSSNKKLLMEIPANTLTKSALDSSYERTIEFENDYDLQAGYSILASTEVAETFKVIVEGRDYKYKA